jgi:hypothetical protein
MATDIDVLVSKTQSLSKQGEVVVAPSKSLAEKHVPANTLPCGAQCPTCLQDGAAGSCMLEAGHTQQHQCNLVPTHQWSSPDSIPGPHGS